MKLALSQIVASKVGVDEVGKIPLPAKVAFRLQKNMRALQAEYDQFEKVRVDLVKRMGVPKEDGTYLVPTEKLQEFQAEMVQLLDETAEVEIVTIRLDDFQAEISALALGALEFMFEE